MSVSVPAPSETGKPVTDAVRQLATGGTNARGSLTLAQGQASTVVQDSLAAPGVMVTRSPRSAAAATIGGVWLSATANGSFTLSHPGAPAGCVFDYEIRR